MAIRTIPARFPLVQQAELAYGRSMKADILRRFAQAQNFLWANVRRAASLWAYDGAGNFIPGSHWRPPAPAPLFRGGPTR